jgi:hypothetical protein
MVIGGSAFVWDAVIIAAFAGGKNLTPVEGLVV